MPPTPLKKRRQPTTIPKLRGFVCAPNFGEYAHLAAVMDDRMRYFAAEFRDGLRSHGKDIGPAEWDFRSISSPEEARFALQWEYDREFEFLYNLQAEGFAACTFEKGSPERHRAASAYRSHWGHELQSEVGTRSRQRLFFPMPWTSIPPEFRKFGKHEFPVIDEIEPAQFADHLGTSDNSKSPFLIRALRIDCSADLKSIRTAFDQWLEKHLRMKEIKTSRGKDANDIFARFRELAAYRMKRAGLSYQDAIDLIGKHRTATPMKGTRDILPAYASSGRWSTSAKRVEGVLRVLYQDDRHYRSVKS